VRLQKVAIAQYSEVSIQNSGVTYQHVMTVILALFLSA